MWSKEGYEFTQDWFTQNIPVWQSIWSQAKFRSVLEIGSFEGMSACFTIEALLGSVTGETQFVAVDEWVQTYQHENIDMAAVEARFDRNAATALARAGQKGAKVNFEKLKGRSAEILPQMIGAKLKFDFIYVDGDHRADAVLRDLIHSFDLLNPGGVLIADDYLWPLQSDNPLNHPKIAIDAFTTIFRKQLAFPAQYPLYQFIVQKTDAPR
jgi:SAM-dependent methyltransferase